MFLLLGLLATPSELLKAAIPGMAVALLLTLVSRPVAVLFCLLPFRWPLRELGCLASVGLRGAMPIILAILPIMSKAPGAHEIFNIAFFGVMMNAVIPGAVVGKLAKWLGVTANEPPAIFEITSGKVLKGEETASFQHARHPGRGYDGGDSHSHL